eukprot:CAMPEP_0204902502 /NCGR_PEP_ID=MMETSP1397-20131031/3702_1 /ASSEMBLY_ACC=CAM_ASM_000891 /TAXON_ID=49980 /ORGANISM="Climacostomum Climacostomum virens, Strain Stock W-24" /LENGTH=382 /DNA_ID=CAMNT_0052071017 /DNA_START=403 /DNA_END=1551 /DNA_ORIENTATION=-
MQIFLKTLRGDKHEIAVDPAMSVAEVKQLISQQLGHDPSLQKLISSGKILEDGKALAEYSINDGDTLVIMVNKPKPATAAQPPRPAPQPQAPSAAPSVAPSQPASFSSEHASTLVTGEAYEDAVTRIVDMGFEREQVQRAMRAAFNNPDRAIEYLFSGIPEEPRSAPHSSGGHHGHHPAPAATTQASGAARSDNPLAFLLDNPMFLQLRTMIQQNPSILPSLLQQLQQTNPQLLAMISQNQDAFMSLINDPLPSDSGPQIDPSLIAGLPRPRNVIQVSPEEAEAIQRLSELGFAQRDALEAYLACDRNEAMAANLLFENYMTIAAMENEAALRASSASAPQPGSQGGSSLADPPAPQSPHDPQDPRRDESQDKEQQDQERPE